MRLSCLQSPFRTVIFAAFLYLFGPACAQAQAPYLYASIPGAGTTSQVVGFSVALDGTLAAVPGSPFNLSSEGGFVTTDPTDQFLFVLNATSNTISVLSIDSATGALSKVGSPVPAPIGLPGSGGLNPSNPVCMATIKGVSPNPSFLFVSYQNTSSPAASFGRAIVAFQIGTTAPVLTPTVQSNLGVTLGSLLTSTNGHLYSVLQSVTGSNQPSGVGVLEIDPVSGAVNLESNEAAIHFNEESIAINPVGTFLFDGWGLTSGGIESSPILNDGSALPTSSSNFVPLSGSSSPPSAMIVDGTGKLLYVEQGGQVATYVIDQSSGALSATGFIPPFTLKLGNTVADPVEPFLYTVQSSNIQVFTITDFSKGTVVEANGSPYPIPGGSGGLALTHNAATQTAAPHAAELVPGSINFIDTTVGQTISDSTSLLTNTGTEPLSIASIAVGDKLDFSYSTTCLQQLPSHSSCSITVTFAPTQAGALGTTLTVTDDADTGSQSVQLTGNGVAVSSGGPGSGSGSGSGGSGGSGSGGSGTGSGSGSGSTGGSGSGGSSGSGSGSGAGSGGSGSGGSGGLPSPTPQPAVTFSATSLTFSAAALNATTPVQNIALTSAAATPLSITAIQLTGPNASDFKLTSDCSTTSGYPQYQGCTLTVAFTPSASGSRFAEVLITDSAPNSPQTISLSGVMQPDSVTISPVTAQGFQESISSGQSALFEFNLVSTFNGTVSFSTCSGAPSDTTCSVPAAISVISNQVIPFSISVAPAASTSVSRFDCPDAHPPAAIPTAQFGQVAGAIPISLALAGVLLVTFGSMRRRGLTFDPVKTSRAFSFSASAIAIALLALTPFALAGCGGASTVAIAPAVTPTAASQTYTITVTPTAVTSANLPVPNVQPITLTLIID